MATASDLQQLYVGYFGRAADQTGLDFWLDAINNGGLSLANVHASFVQSEEFMGQYEGLSSGDLVAQVYLNVLGRPADAAGQEFWTNALSDGLITEDQLIEGVLSGLSPRDALIISNKVTVANYYTAVRGAEYNQDDKADSGDILLGVNADTASVVAALQTIVEDVEGPGASNDDLAAALVSLQAAIDAQEAYAQAYLDDENGTVADAQVAIDSAVTTALGDLNTAISALNVSAATIGGADSAAVVQVKLNDATTAAATAVTNAQNAVNAVAGLNTAANTYVNALASYTAAQEAQTAALLEQDAELARFNVVNGNTTLTVDATTGEVTGVLVVANGQLVVAPAYLEASNDNLDAAANALLADVQARLAADRAETSAETTLSNAIARVETLETATTGVDSDSDLEIDTGLVADLAEARAEQAALAEEVEDFNEANATAAEFEALSDAVVDAEAAIDTLGFELTEVADGVGVAADAEVFISTGTDATGAATLADFSGDDVLFVGNGYVLGADSDAAAAGIQGGNNAALEVFFTQVGDNAVVNIETSPFGSSAATAEFQQITLTGVTMDELSFDANTGFVSVA
ncbi:DUF4214 domain-containing protein [Stutzerimonas stutzeri]|uniref:DUF4214 domain-containing protein n=1 Tax=Stutzerimonas stutzeri TaxID=316 RepID=UPI00210D1051|nr:DUF4214 domain-containing protein [Stutzerimonas stutzeri]MCQ4322840.1 DUF4214 domain-containing protein [Stutzerimonas stutzeri]